MQQIVYDVVIIGAGPAGLASAASLRQAGIDQVLLLEQGQAVGWRWQGHYQRLHLHTAKYLSSLPGRRFPHAYPLFPSRQQFLDYLQAYAKHFQLAVRCDERVVQVRRLAGSWQLTTQSGQEFSGRHLIVATGRNDTIRQASLPGSASFHGKLMHSRAYCDPQSFQGQRVLVVGAGNSGAEIALDLANAGLEVALSLRSPTHVVPLRSLGLPTQATNILLSYLPQRLGSAVSRLFLRLRYGDLTRYGLPRPPGSPLEQIRQRGRVPVIDVGTIARIKEGRIRVLPETTGFAGEAVLFRDGRREPFTSVILATGYQDGTRVLFDDTMIARDPLGYPQAAKAEGLHLIGFHDQGRGNLFEIRREAPALARKIAAALRPKGGRFAWLQRMGVHQASHRNAVNRLIHLAGIPLISWGVLNALATVKFEAWGASCDLALILIALVGPLYVALDLGAGALLLGLLLGVWGFLLHPLPGLGAWGNCLLGAGAVALGFASQILLGHGRFEPQARDDTKQNLRALAATKNPIPSLLIVFYHFIEVLFAMGYKPALAAQISQYCEAELQRLSKV